MQMEWERWELWWSAVCGLRAFGERLSRAVTLYKFKAITTAADPNKVDLRDPLKDRSIFLISTETS